MFVMAKLNLMSSIAPTIGLSLLASYPTLAYTSSIIHNPTPQSETGYAETSMSLDNHIKTQAIRSLWIDSLLPFPQPHSLQLQNMFSNQVSAIAGESINQKPSSYLIAQFGGSRQVAVNFIHSLRKKGSIKVGTDNTYIFGDVRGDHVRIGTTASGRGPYSNWVVLTEMPSRNGFSFRAVGSASYQLHGTIVNGKFMLCSSSCPVYSVR